MHQFFAGKEELKIEQIPKGTPIEQKIFLNQLIPSKRNNPYTLSNMFINYSTFANIGFRFCKFKQIDFSHCTFINCHFGSADFEDVNFVECKFIDCNFNQATFIACDFRYAKFTGCFIQYRYMKANLPGQPNLRWDLCKNLTMVCLSLGEVEDFRYYFFEEKSASEQHYLKMFKQDEKWYQDKYEFWDSIEGITKYVSSKISKFLWGYGESIHNLLAIIGATILFFAIVFSLSPEAFLKENDNVTSLNFFESLFYSISNFFNISAGYNVADGLIGTAVIFENIIGLVFTGFLIAAIFRYINRR